MTSRVSSSVAKYSKAKSYNCKNQAVLNLVYKPVVTSYLKHCSVLWIEIKLPHDLKKESFCWKDFSAILWSLEYIFESIL